MKKIVLAICVIAVALAAGYWWGQTASTNSVGIASIPAPEGTPHVASEPRGASASTRKLSRATSVQAMLPSTPKSADVLERERRGREGTRHNFTGRPAMTYTVQNLAAQFASLSMKAEAGDLMASRTLFEGLENCDSAPRTPKRLQQMRDITAASFARNPPPPGDYSRGDPVASDAMIISRFERCGGVTDEHLAERAKFGQQLADSGDEFARLQYQEWAMPTAEHPDYAARLAEVRAQTARYLDEELAQGNSRALRSYGAMYATNRLGARDPYQLYRYGYAYLQTPGLSAGDVVYSGLAAAQSRLTPEQVAQAQSEGVALFNQCCRGP